LWLGASIKLNGTLCATSNRWLKHQLNDPSKKGTAAMSNQSLSGKRIAFLATDGFEQSELVQPWEAIEEFAEGRHANQTA
jgi:hypothetical protein